ncbi:hypothetical protein [Streptomyces sp. NPDC059651]
MHRAAPPTADSRLAQLTGTIRVAEGAAPAIAALLPLDSGHGMGRGSA